MKDEVKAKIAIVKLLQRAMESSGMNQAELARRSGVSTGVVSRILSNPDKGCSAYNLFAILDALGLINEPEQKCRSRTQDNDSLQKASAILSSENKKIALRFALHIEETFDEMAGLGTKEDRESLIEGGTGRHRKRAESST